jgi:hypothetical protein
VVFKEFQAMVETSSRRKIKAIWGDNGGEFIFKTLPEAKQFSYVSKLKLDHGLPHWQVVKRIFRCKVLVALQYYVDSFKKDIGVQLYGFCDLDWGGDLDTRRSKQVMSSFLEK